MSDFHDAETGVPEGDSRMINDHPFRIKCRRIDARSWKFIKHRFIWSPLGFDTKREAQRWISDHESSVLQHMIVPKPAGGWGRKKCPCQCHGKPHEKSYCVNCAGLACKA